MFEASNCGAANRLLRSKGFLLFGSNKVKEKTKGILFISFLFVLNTKRNKKVKTRRSLPASPLFAENINQKARSVDNIFSRKGVHPSTASRLAKPSRFFEIFIQLNIIIKYETAQMLRF
ncbi:MAG: hypothetical protein M3R27_11365 [Bacteroidota bacterium]|nr:hypothetical protein [Bacteroidota bacterium]